MTDYIPASDDDTQLMMKEVGIKAFDELFVDIPAEHRLSGLLDIPPPMPEQELRKAMVELSQKNIVPKLSFAGAGCYHHFSPSVVNHIISRSEFFTAYTPYQPEISQGALQTIYEFQTMIARLTGMDAANASMYDGSTALAEAANASCIFSGRKTVLISKAVHPQYRQVVKTYMDARGASLVEIGFKDGQTDLASVQEHLSDDVAAVIIQSPNYFGVIEDQQAIAALAHEKKALAISCFTEGISLGLLKPAGELGVDICVGEGQSFGLPVSYGGPYVGLFAAKMEHVRKVPGRIVGKSLDADGRDAYVLTLQAREQHIRREKASSNICSNQGLCAIAAAVYLSMAGKRLRDIAYLNAQHARYAAKVLAPFGKLKFSKHYFNEFVFQIDNAKALHAALLERGIHFGVLLEDVYPELKDCVLVCATELTGKEDIDRLAAKVASMKG